MDEAEVVRIVESTVTKKEWESLSAYEVVA